MQTQVKENVDMVPSMRRYGYTLLLGCLLVFSCALAACGGDNTASSNNSSAYASDSKAGQTITVKESKGADGKDVYAFNPASITVNKGDTITVQNQSDELQDIDEGDVSKAGVDAKIPVNQSVAITFKNVGTFTLKSEKGATITVTVK